MEVDFKMYANRFFSVQTFTCTIKTQWEGGCVKSLSSTACSCHNTLYQTQLLNTFKKSINLPFRCSTKVDENGVHVGGIDAWGYCDYDCLISSQGNS
jgi:hypothetical protein